MGEIAVNTDPPVVPHFDYNHQYQVEERIPYCDMSGDPKAWSTMCRQRFRKCLFRQNLIPATSEFCKCFYQSILSDTKCTVPAKLITPATITVSPTRTTIEDSNSQRIVILRQALKKSQSENGKLKSKIETLINKLIKIRRIVS